MTGFNKGNCENGNKANTYLLKLKAVARNWVSWPLYLILTPGIHKAKHVKALSARQHYKHIGKSKSRRSLVLYHIAQH